MRFILRLITYMCMHVHARHLIDDGLYGLQFINCLHLVSMKDYCGTLETMQVFTFVSCLRDYIETHDAIEKATSYQANGCPMRHKLCQYTPANSAKHNEYD